ncbi:colicin-A [Escherichia coli MP021552.8]|nr:colicin-A [Escherichia coli MP021552.8]
MSGMGDKLGEYLGVKYKNLAKEVANDIKNFHGRNIRSYNEAMASLNKVLANPKMKVNKSDKDAIVNAWKQVNAKDMANKIGNLGKAFKVADLAIKVEKIREKALRDTILATGDLSCWRLNHGSLVALLLELLLVYSGLC